MSKTKFIKVSVEERLPEKEGQYTVQRKDSGSENQHYHEMYYYNGSPLNESFWKAYIEYWLEEVPDREEEMREMLERIHKESHYYNQISSDTRDEIEQLINELKQ